MKKKLIAIIGLTILLITASVSLIYAWYINTNKVGHIDAQSDGIVLVYKLNGEYNKTNEYSINNLVFFDIDNKKETKYFKSMAYKIEILLENKGTKDVVVSLTSTNTSIMQYESDSSTEASNAYADVIFTEEKIADYSNDSLATVYSEYIEGNEEISNILVSAGQAKTIYAYVFGVQEMDNAKNEDFLDDTYLFDITINAQ